MLRKLMLLPAVTATIACQDAADPVHAAHAVPVELPEVEPTEPPALVTVAGTVRVFGQEDVTLSGVSVCEETTATCTTSDGAGGFELFAPRDTDLVLTAKRPDLVVSLLPFRADPDLSIDLRVVPRAAATAFVELADGEASDRTGMVFVTAVDPEGAPLADMWMTIRDFAAWGPIFTEPGIVPALDRKRTGANGFGAYLELPVGTEEIGVGGPGRQCDSRYVPATDEGLFAVEVRGEAVTWLQVVCS